MSNPRKQETNAMKRHRMTVLLSLFVLALAITAGTAFAGGGNGNGNGGSNGNGNSANAPGQQKQQSAPQPSTAPTGASKQDSKQSSTSPSAPATGGDNSHGVKPSNSTKHDTYAKASSDQTKSYGNGKTAGQIATQAGYGDATLHGPGNSQPHKALCGGHEVDVHALAHKGSKCGAPPAAPTAKTPAKVTPPPVVQPSVAPAAVCGTTTKVVTEQVLTGVEHMIGPKGSGRFVVIHPSLHSAHYTGKHPDDVPLYETVTKTIAVPTAACASTETHVVTTSVVTPPAPATLAPAVVASPATTTAAAVQSAQATATTPASVATPVATPGAAPAAAGAVKGVQIALKPTAKPKPAGGVLGTTTRLGSTVASSTLPFTGLPLWIFALVAAALIGIGVATRRASANNRV
jgi:hypothetical protein